VGCSDAAGSLDGISEEVREALAAGGSVVALESTIIAHGLPRPRNLEVARQLETEVRAAGAVPATIAVLGGEVRVGLDDAALERIAAVEMAKLSVRDVPLAAARRVDGATTVAATAHLAARAGIRVFATGGLGGVHRGSRESWDESADLLALARTPITVVAAGVKSILDIGATLERLETLGVAIAGWRTSRFPGFYVTDGGFDLDWRVDDAEEVAAAMAAADALGVETALLIANPVESDLQLDPEEHERVLGRALERARAEGVSGKAVTPFLLAYLHEATEGRSLEVNVAVARGNAGVAGAIAAAWGRAR
jgi:pseudouridine-5'-phosphate glycosidase